MPKDTYVDVLDDAHEQAFNMIRIVAAAMLRAPLDDEVGDYVSQNALDALFDQALTPSICLLAAAAFYADREHVKRTLDGSAGDAQKRAHMKELRKKGRNVLSRARKQLLESVAEGAA